MNASEVLEVLKALKPYANVDLGQAIDLFERLSSGQSTDKGLQGILEQLRWHDRIGKLTVGNPLAVKRLRKFCDKLETEMSTDWPESYRKFWQETWTEVLGRNIEVPPVPQFAADHRRTLEAYNFMTVYLPAVSEDEYPKSFYGTGDWTNYYYHHERIPLNPRWLAIEITDVVWPQDELGDNDRLYRELHIWKRHPFTPAQVEEQKERAEIILEMPGHFNLPSVEELNLIGNIFNWLRRKRVGIQVPDFTFGADGYGIRCRNPVYSNRLGESLEKNYATFYTNSDHAWCHTGDFIHASWDHSHRFIVEF